MVRRLFARGHRRLRMHDEDTVAELTIRKKDIQEAKRPDAVLEGATSLFDTLLEKRTQIIGGLAAVLAVVAIASFVSNRSAKASHEAGAKLSAALALEAKPVKEPAKDKAEDGESDGDSFPSKEAKQKAVEDALAPLAKGSDAAAARGASLALAQRAYDAGKFDDALAGFEVAAKGDGALALPAFEGQGYAYEAKGDFTKAGEAFAKLKEYGAEGRAQFHAARLLEKQGKKDEARKAYEAVADKFENDAIASEARTRIDLLDLPAAGVGALAAPAPVETAPAKK
jgi:tetratricopeptide (TPR) repeat protein